MIKRFTAILLALVLFVLPAAAAPQTGSGADLTISNVHDFLTFAENCRLDSYSRNLTVSLEVDIDLSGVKFDPIPIFCGTFLGNQHTVFGLNLTGDGSAQGLFRCLTAQATVQELHVRGSVQPGGSRSYVAGIAGSNAGIIRGCSFRGTVSGSGSVGGIAGRNLLSGTIENCVVNGFIHGMHFVGGIAGENLGVIRECSNFAAVNTTAKQNEVDISDITLDSITGSESSFSSTDIGGIAGISSGVIRSCDNQGSVGYHLMGYNVGGIAGTQSGYMTDCRNRGEIRGRKDVGGIVGQLEPATQIRYSEDSLQTLSGQLDTLSDLTDSARKNTQAGMTATQNRLDLLQQQAQQASDAIAALTPDGNQPPDPDSVTAAVGQLSDALTAMGGTAGDLTDSLSDTASSLGRDLQRLEAQMNLISQTAGSSQENVGGSFRDVSDLDTADDLLGKVSDSTNTGELWSDLNGGGIVGAIAMETDLDVLEDWESIGELSMNFEGDLRAVILNCENIASITVNKQNVGGIVGIQTMGLVRQCVNTGDLTKAEARYVGGISGSSMGFIRDCSSKCRLSGASFVGGIAGAASTVTDCISILQILHANEQAGGILGTREESQQEDAQVKGNFYLSASADPGGIDGISYDGAAKALPLDELTALERFPARFRQVNISFRMPSGSGKSFSVPLGSSLDPQLIPVLPKKDGQSAYWDGLEDSNLKNLFFDLSFESTCNAPARVIESTQQRNGLPILLLEGAFLSDPAVTTALCSDLPSLSKSREVLECLEFSVTGCQDLSTAHYLPAPEMPKNRLTLYVRDGDGQWQSREFTREGRYLLFELNSGDSAFALTHSPVPLLLYVLTGCGILLIAAAAVTAAVIRGKKKAKEEKSPV